MPGYTDYDRAYQWDTDLFNQEMDELDMSFRHDSARWLTDLLPTVQKYIINYGGDDNDARIPYPEGDIEVYSRDTFVALMFDGSFIKYTYVYHYEPNTYHEQGFTEEYVEWEEVT